MLEDAPLVTVRRNTPRPSAEQVAAIAGAPTGFVVDALGGRGAMGPAVKPVVAEQSVFCGVAVTCHAGPADNLALLAALPLLQPGDVAVVATDGYVETAVVGDLLLQMAMNRGAAALVTDGAVRDTPGIRHVGLPCFATAVTPNSPAKNGPGVVNEPIVLAGLAVAAGDIVVGDVDGVVVVPHARIDEVIAKLAEVRRAEAEMLAKVEGGLGAPAYIEDMYASGKVREIG